MLSNCHLTVYSYFCDKKNSLPYSIIDGIEVLKCSSGLVDTARANAFRISIKIAPNSSPTRGQVFTA
jgi:hypothetical protein